ncbi:sensor histidine kinase [Dactylosporangium matsuzakiense]|uniref:histidine kinase n=1 Tax=Dactylosporangium matsuzakiense TaxID=53360 RepID=A0A9W6NMU6_9ACTN|nr:histidine kinase [Dactylosporangium matsuzakiense]GLL02819.1 two-component sensor histidine kinase [Dactylosporangium matsuzakiense]
MTDALIVGASLLLTVLAVETPWSPLPSPVVGTAGTLAALAQWWRRSHPHVAAVIGALGYALSGSEGPLLSGLYAAGAYGTRRLAWSMVAVGWAGATGLNSVRAGRLDWWDAEFAAVVAAATVGLGIHVKTRRALREAWRERAERADAERVLRDESARTAERARIAREMHDVLAHRVSLIALHAGALELTADGGTERIRDGAGLIRVTAREALAELRVVLGVLQADAQPYVDLHSVVADARSAGQRVVVRDSAGQLPASATRVVQRVVQEGLTNARKHAPGAEVTVTIERSADGVAVTVVNPVTGATLDLPGSGTGLVGLAERVRLVGGTLTAGPAGIGWRLRAQLPVAVPAGEPEPPPSTSAAGSSASHSSAVGASPQAVPGMLAVEESRDGETR